MKYRCGVRLDHIDVPLTRAVLVRGSWIRCVAVAAPSLELIEALGAQSASLLAHCCGLEPADFERLAEADRAKVRAAFAEVVAATCRRNNLELTDGDAF